MDEPTAPTPPDGSTETVPPPAPPAAEEAASEAAAILARRKAEVAEGADDDAPVRMVDLHDVREELRGELRRLQRAETVPHAVPPPSAAPAQTRRAGTLGIVVGVVVVVALFGLAVLAERRR